MAKYKGIVGGALAGLALTAFTTTAQAGVMAFSILDVSDFKAVISGGANDGTQLDLSDFSSIGLTAQASTSADLGAGSASDTDSDGFTSTVGVIGDGTADPLPAQLGVAFANNDFARKTSSGPIPPLTQGVNFTRSDANDTGAPITGVGLTPDVDATTLAEGELVGIIGGSAGADISVTSRIEFVANFSEMILFDFDAAAFAETYASGAIGDIADADTNFSIRVDEDSGLGFVNILNFAPSALNLDVNSSLLFPGTNNAGSLIAASYMTSAFSVIAGNTYRVTIEHGSDIQLVSSIASPGTLGLLGTGLLGIGFVARRRRTAK